MNDAHITKFRTGFPWGYTKVLSLDDVTLNVGMEFGILKLKAGSTYARKNALETQVVLLKGAGTMKFNDKRIYIYRKDIFPVFHKRTNKIIENSDRNPWAFDFPPNCGWKIFAATDLEVAIIATENSRVFDPVVVHPDEVPSEQRGEGNVGGTMHRIVKAVLGDPNAPYRPLKSNLVVGEVVNFPGKWSSYPPHYHPHNEVYYYRFDLPQGYGASFIDQGQVPRIYNHDIVKIMNCVGHSQVSAPGYAMWYLWFIRQIDGNRYEGSPPFKFFPEHEWVLQI